MWSSWRGGNSAELSKLEQLVKKAQSNARQNINPNDDPEYQLIKAIFKDKSLSSNLQRLATNTYRLDMTKKQEYKRYLENLKAHVGQGSIVFYQGTDIKAKLSAPPSASPAAPPSAPPAASPSGFRRLLPGGGSASESRKRSRSTGPQTRSVDQEMQNRTFKAEHLNDAKAFATEYIQHNSTGRQSSFTFNDVQDAAKWSMRLSRGQTVIPEMVDLWLQPSSYTKWKGIATITINTNTSGAIYHIGPALFAGLKKGQSPVWLRNVRTLLSTKQVQSLKNLLFGSERFQYIFQALRSVLTGFREFGWKMRMFMASFVIFVAILMAVWVDNVTDEYIKSTITWLAGKGTLATTSILGAFEIYKLIRIGDEVEKFGDKLFPTEEKKIMYAAVSISMMTNFFAEKVSLPAWTQVVPDTFRDAWRHIFLSPGSTDVVEQSRVVASISEFLGYEYGALLLSRLYVQPLIYFYNNMIEIDENQFYITQSTVFDFSMVVTSFLELMYVGIVSKKFSGAPFARIAATVLKYNFDKALKNGKSIQLLRVSDKHVERIEKEKSILAFYNGEVDDTGGFDTYYVDSHIPEGWKNGGLTEILRTAPAEVDVRGFFAAIKAQDMYDIIRRSLQLDPIDDVEKNMLDASSLKLILEARELLTPEFLKDCVQIDTRARACNVSPLTIGDGQYANLIFSVVPNASGLTPQLAGSRPTQFGRSLDNVVRPILWSQLCRLTYTANDVSKPLCETITYAFTPDTAQFVADVTKQAAMLGAGPLYTSVASLVTAGVAMGHRAIRNFRQRKAFGQGRREAFRHTLPTFRMRNRHRVTADLDCRSKTNINVDLGNNLTNEIIERILGKSSWFLSPMIYYASQ